MPPPSSKNALADTSAYYEISFDPPTADPGHKYQLVEVRVGKPGLIARTPQGYYLQP